MAWMKFTSVEYVVTEENKKELDLEARIGGFRVGVAWCTRSGDSLKIEDLNVDPQIERRWPLHLRLLERLGIWHPPHIRRHGIGSGLLERLFARADSTGVHEIWGIVTQDDLDETPTLLTWYKHRGFKIQELDDKSNPRAVKKIVRRII
jgi:GNAT superfamily N-acetyltransferase